MAADDDGVVAEEAERLFALTSAVQQTTIVGYKTSPCGQWYCVSGIMGGQGGVVGKTQLYSVAAEGSQSLDAFGGDFASWREDDGSDSTLFAFCAMSSSQSAVLKLAVTPVGVTKDAEGVLQTSARKAQNEIPLRGEGDFPVSVVIRKHFCYCFTKEGNVIVFDVLGAEPITAMKLPAPNVFIAVPDNDRIVGVSKDGQVLAIQVDEDRLLNYLLQRNKAELAVSLAKRLGLSDADHLFAQQFEGFFNAKDYKAAAGVCLSFDALRTSQTVMRFEQAPTLPGEHPPLIQYFSTVSEDGPLNEVESMKLATLLLEQGKAPLLEKWITRGKLTFFEELGDVVLQSDQRLGLSIYIRANSHSKVCKAFGELGMYDKIVAYCQKKEYEADWEDILVTVAQHDADQALALSRQVAELGLGSFSPLSLVEIFVSQGMIKAATDILLDQIRNESEAEEPLQTRLIEINLAANQSAVVEKIVKSGMCQFYDKARVAPLCERKGLYGCALLLYPDTENCRRVLTHSTVEEIKTFFGAAELDASGYIECLRELALAKAYMEVFLEMCVELVGAAKVSAKAVVKLLEEVAAPPAVIYKFLNEVIWTHELDSSVYTSFATVAAKTGHLKDIERMIKDTTAYDPAEVKDFLKSIDLQDKRPLVLICDKHNFVAELVTYLYNGNMLKFVEAYVESYNPGNTPVVIGALIDCGCNEEFIRALLEKVQNFDAAELVSVVEGKNRLKIIRSWLEGRAKAGDTLVEVHSALAKIYVDLNHSPLEFLRKDQYYDARDVGKYCEKRDPRLACEAYMRAQCDEELIELTERAGFFKIQAKYLVQRQSEELWAQMLSGDNSHREEMIDYVISHAVPESNSDDEVRATVKAFIDAKLPTRLLEVLEKIVLQDSSFSDNGALQELLILTAIKADKSRVMEYVTRLSEFDYNDIAGLCIKAKLFDEAIYIYEKNKEYLLGFNVLINGKKDMEKAEVYAQRVDTPDVWGRFGLALLEQAGESDTFLEQAVDCLLKAHDTSVFLKVIQVCKAKDSYKEMVRYLQMCRREKVEEPLVDTELAFSLAMCNELALLDSLLALPNHCQVPVVADRCFHQDLFDAAKTLYSSIGNYQGLALSLVKLERYPQAIDAARKANSTSVWKSICCACVEADEFSLAQRAGINIVVHSDELDELVSFYETRGFHAEVMALLETSLGLEKAHLGMFTALGVLYAKYRPEKLMEHVTVNASRINTHRLIRQCEENGLWAVLVYLHHSDGEYDNACSIMMDHIDCFNHDSFKEMISQVANLDVIHRAIDFYLKCHPLKLADLLLVMDRVDSSRLIDKVKDTGVDSLHLVLPWLQHIQTQNLRTINDTLNALYIETVDHEALMASIRRYANVDLPKLAKNLSRHDLLQFRRVAVQIYRQCHQFSSALDLAIECELWGDAVAVAAEDAALVTRLLDVLVEKKQAEAFAAALLSCDVSPSVALAAAWRAGWTDHAMPYFIDSLARNEKRVAALEQEVTALKAASNPVQPQDEEYLAGQGADEDLFGSRY